MLLIGLDPSFKRTGISIYSDGKFYVTETRLEPNSDKSFEQVYHDAYKQAFQVVKEIDGVLLTLNNGNDPNVKVITEVPPPQGNFAPGLYALDTLIITLLKRRHYEVYRVYPTFIQHVHGKRKFQKSESVKIAEEILSHYESEVLSKRLSHDEAEAVIFNARLLAREGLLNEVTLSKYKGLRDEKEAEITL